MAQPPKALLILGDTDHMARIPIAGIKLPWHSPFEAYANKLEYGLYNISFDWLTYCHGKGRVAALMQPDVRELSAVFKKHGRGLESLVFIGHAEFDEGAVINNSGSQNTWKPGWLKAWGGPFRLREALFYACYQAAEPQKTRWCQNLGTPPGEFFGFTGAEIPLSASMVFVNFIETLADRCGRERIASLPLHMQPAREVY